MSKLSDYYAFQEDWKAVVEANEFYGGKPLSEVSEWAARQAWDKQQKRIVRLILESVVIPEYVAPANDGEG